MAHQQPNPLGVPVSKKQTEVELDEFKVKRGGGGIIAVILIVILLGGGGAAVAYFLMQEDPSVAHDHFRREIFGKVHNAYYPAFWGCALNAPFSNYKNNKALMTKIEQNATGSDTKRYGEHILENEKCIPLLESSIPEYKKLKTNEKTPAEYHEILDGLVEDVEYVKRAWQDFAEFLLQAEERKIMKDSIKKSGEGWVGYQTCIRDRVRSRLPRYESNAVAYVNFISCVLGEKEFTSFQPESGMSAEDKLEAYLDDQCVKNKNGFIEKMMKTCKEHLAKTDGKADRKFKSVLKHWSKKDNDFASGIPMINCIDELEKSKTRDHIAGIAKAWYMYNKTYSGIVEISKSQSNSPYNQ